MATPLDAAWQFVAVRCQATMAPLGQSQPAGCGLLASCSFGLAVNCLAVGALAQSAFRATGTATLLIAVCAIDSASLLATCLPMGLARLDSVNDDASNNEHLCRALPYLQLSLHACQAALHCLLAGERLLCRCYVVARSRLTILVAALVATLCIVHLPMLTDIKLLEVHNSSVINGTQCSLLRASNGYSSVGLPWLAFALQLALPALLAVLTCAKLALTIGVGGGRIDGSNSSGGGSGGGSAATSSAESWCNQLATVAICAYALCHLPVTLLRYLLLLDSQLAQHSLQQASTATLCTAHLAAGLASVLRPCAQPIAYLLACPVYRREFQQALCQCRRSHLQPKDSVMVMRSRELVKS